MDSNRRQSTRYQTRADVNFTYDFDASLEVHPLMSANQTVVEKYTYKGRIQNISTEGISFYSDQELHQGDVLSIDVFIPGKTNPVHLQGMVRWIKRVDREISKKDEGHNFDAGVKVTNIEGKPVSQTVWFDQVHGIYWSDVLESILGAYRIYSQQKPSS